MTLVTNVALLLGAFAALFIAVVLLRSWPQIGAVIAAAFVLVAWEVPNPPPLLEVSGVSIYLLDFVSVVFLVTAVTGFRRVRQRLGGVGWGWGVFAVVLVASLVRGVLSYDIGTVFVEFRGFLYPMAAAVWALTVEWDAVRARAAIERYSLFLGWGLVVVAGIHLVLYGFGGASDLVDPTTGFDQTQRPLIAGQALVLLLCTIVTFSAWSRTRRLPAVVSGVAFLFVLVLAQQRSVWVAALAVAIVGMILGGGRTRSRYVVVAFVMAALAIVFAATGLADSLVGTVTGSLGDTGTFFARQNSWTALIARTWAEGPGMVLFGEPFGAGFGRFEGPGRWVEFAPHNWYVSIYLRAGVVGLLGYLVTLFGLVMRAARAVPAEGTAKVSILTALVVFGGAYSWLWYTAPFFGWSANSPAQRPAAGETADVTTRTLAAPKGRS